MLQKKHRLCYIGDIKAAEASQARYAGKVVGPEPRDNKNRSHKRTRHMKQTINFHDFADAFRAIRPDNFSHDGLRALFDYLEEYEESCDQTIELDVIALCGDYSEDSIENVLKEYDMADIEELRDNTQVIDVDDETIIYSAF